jgi:hypothetical protein
VNVLLPSPVQMPSIGCGLCSLVMTYVALSSCLYRGLHNAAGSVKVVTDADGAFNTTLNVFIASVPTNQLFVTPVSVTARWLDPTRSPVIQQVEVYFDSFEALVATYPDPFSPRIPGIEFAIVPTLLDAGTAPAPNGLTAAVYATEVTPALCEALAFCSPADLGLNLKSISFGYYEETGIEDGMLLNGTEADVVKAAGMEVCTGYPVGIVDWAACRWTLPKVGLFLITLCNNGGTCYTSPQCVPFFFALCPPTVSFHCARTPHSVDLEVFVLGHQSAVP